jgi:hypothetical protein
MGLVFQGAISLAFLNSEIGLGAFLKVGIVFFFINLYSTTLACFLWPPFRTP